MEELFYTRDNYCISIDNDIATVGLTSFILDDINIVNFIELPAIGSICSKTELIGQINYNDDENLDLYSVFSGRIVDVNDSLVDNTEQLFSNDMENSWIYRICLNTKAELENELMSEEEYEEYLEEIK
ncbi:glycine cleavage system H protein [Bacilli bacterium]|nr:glycine cleavage system H protein [Bacilli bacterium]